MKQLIRGLRLLICLLALQGFAQAQVVAPGEALGPAFKINESVRGLQKFLAVATNDSGEGVAVWIVPTPPNTRKIIARRLGRDGAPLGPEILVGDGGVPEYSDTQQLAVAIDGQGSFVVGWADLAEGSRLRVRRYASDGTPRGDAFDVYSDAGDGLLAPSLAMNSRGDFVVLWSVFPRKSGVGNTPLAIKLGRLQARRYDAGSDAGGPVITVERNLLFEPAYYDIVGRHARNVSVGIEGDGSFVAVWNRHDKALGISGSFLRHYNRLGLPGLTVRLNALDQPALSGLQLAVNDGGRAMVAFLKPSRTSPTVTRAFVRAFVGGLPETADIQVADIEAVSVTLAIDDAGAAVVAATTSGPERDIVVQRFASGGGLLNIKRIATQDSKRLTTDSGAFVLVAIDNNARLLAASIRVTETGTYFSGPQGFSSIGLPYVEVTYPLASEILVRAYAGF